MTDPAERRWLVRQAVLDWLFRQSLAGTTFWRSLRQLGLVFAAAAVVDEKASQRDFIRSVATSPTVTASGWLDIHWP